MNGLAHPPVRAARQQPFDPASYFESLTCAYEVGCETLDGCQASGDRAAAKLVAKHLRELRGEINKVARRLFGAGSPVARLLNLDFKRATARRRRQWH